MKRLVNIRIPVLLTFALVAGTGLEYLFFSYGISLFAIIAVVPVAAVIFILCAVFKRSNACLFTIALTVLVIIGGAGNCYLRLNSFSADDIIDGDTYYVYATVDEKGENAYGEYIILTRVTASGKKVNGKIIAYLGEAYGDFCDTGYKVNFTAKLNKNDLFKNGKLNYYAQENVKYSCNVYGGLNADYGFSLFGTMRSAIRKTLYSNLNKDTAAVALAMLTGNTQGMDEDMLTSFRYGGIAHVFAVSGLHIGIVYGILLFICKRLKLNKYVTAAICILPLFFYSGVCGFTLSSVRAAIMCTVSAIAKLLYKKYDGLNSLAVAAGIILTISPLSLFNAGFQLSVCAVGGIHILKLPKKAPPAIKVPFAAQAATAPILLANFGYLSGAGIFLNVLLIPILSAFFVVLFIGTIVATLLPFTAFLLPYAVLPLEALISFFTTAGFEKALIYYGSGTWIPFYYAGLFTLSDKININPFMRFIGACCAVAAICLCVIFA